MYQDYTDAAFKDARRQLDPVWEQNQRSFDQSMINKGFTPGSKGYTSAEDNLNRGRNDQYGSAAFDSMQYGANRMDADRGFNENQRQFNSQFGLAKDQFKEGQKQYGKNFGETQRQYNQDFGENSRRFDLGFGESRFQDRRDFGEDNRRFDKQFDLNEVSTLDNISRAYNDQSYRDAVFNASRDDQQLNQLYSLMGFAPTGGAQPINMTSAFNSQLYGDVKESERKDARSSRYGDIFGDIYGSA
jgi:hypothetical protein